jgi:hypothetical protein
VFPHSNLFRNGIHHVFFSLQRGGEVEVAIVTSLFAERDVDVEMHRAKLRVLIIDHLAFDIWRSILNYVITRGMFNVKRAMPNFQ